MTCTMGVGCDETGVCYALAHGEPERCARIPERCTCDKPTWDDPFVGMCDRCEELARIERHAQGIEARQGGNGEAGAVHESPTPLGDAPDTMGEPPTPHPRETKQ